ncbi:MAG: hypothetical protein K5893_09830 [Prevotella sp.]|nr:hypothetical protein [Prevotella sp.]
MKKLEKMIKAYNKKAAKWGFDSIEIVDGKISRPFVEKPLEHLPFFPSLKIAYQNGYFNPNRSLGRR